MGTALFVAAEFSLVALDRPTVQRAVDAGEPGAKSVLTSHRRLSTQLSACQLGITLTTLVLGFIASPSIGVLLQGPLRVGWACRRRPPRRWPSVLAMLIATVFSMIVGEMVPKTLGDLAAAGHRQGRGRAGAVVRHRDEADDPRCSTGSPTAPCWRSASSPQEELSAARSPAELASLVRSSAEAGTLDREHRAARHGIPRASPTRPPPT